MGVALVMNVRRNRANLDIVEAFLKKRGFEFAFVHSLGPPGDPYSLVRAARNLQTASDGGTCDERVQRALYVLKIRDADQIAGAVEADQVAHPGECGDIRDRVVTHDPRAVREPRIEHAEQALRFADVAIARALVLEILACELMEEADLAEHRADAGHLEHEPLDRLVARRRIRRKKLSALLGEID